MSTSTPARGPSAGPRPVPDNRIQRRSRLLPWLLIGAGVTVLLLIGAGALSWDVLNGGGIGSSVEQHQTYQHSVSALTYSGASSDVQVLGGALPGTVAVTRTLRWGPGSSQPQPQETWAGDTLEITAQCSGSFLSWCSIDYIVRVPDATAVTVENGSGNVVLDGALGTVSAKAGSGNLEVNQTAAREVHLETGSGSIDANFVVAPDKVDAKAGSGNISVLVPRGEAYAVDVSVGSGNQNVTVDTSATSSRSIRVDTGSGNVTIAYR